MAGPFAFRRISLVHNIGISWQYRLLKENQQEGNQRHRKRVEFGQPCDNDGGEAVSACRAGGNRLIAPADNQKARQAAQCTREDHGADNHLADVNARVARGVFALADDGNFIALFGIAQIAIHDDCQRDDDDQIDGITLTHDLREPAGLGFHVQLAQAGSLTAPDVDAAGDNLNCDVIHHQREEGFVCGEACFEPRGDEAPQRAGQNAGDEHRRIQQRIREFSAVIDHHGGGGQRPHQNLPLRARVPETHFEGRSQRDADQQERGEVAHRP